MTIHEKSIQLIMRHEACRLKPYYDTSGVLTVGWGHNLERDITQAEADRLLAMDLEQVEAQAKSFAWYSRLNPARRAVIENMIYNLGFGRFSRFQKTIAAIERRDYAAAADEMLRGSGTDGVSLWFEQVGDRARQLSDMMRRGDFVE